MKFIQFLQFFLFFNSFLVTFSYVVKREYGLECKLSIDKYLATYSEILNSPDRETTCTNITSNYSYRMFKEGVKVLPGCEGEDNLMVDIYSPILKSREKIALDTFEYYCTKDEKGIFCPYSDDDDSFLEMTCKSKICREKYTILLKSTINFYPQLKQSNPEDTPPLSDFKNELNDLKSEECLNGTFKYEDKNISESDNKDEINNKNNGNDIKIKIGIAIAVLGLIGGIIFLIIRSKKPGVNQTLKSDINNNNYNSSNYNCGNNNNNVSPLITQPNNVQVIYSPYQQSQYPVINSVAPQVYVLQPSNPNDVTSPLQDSNLPTYNQVIEERINSPQTPLSSRPENTSNIPLSSRSENTSNISLSSRPENTSNIPLSSRSENTSNISLSSKPENTSNIIDATTVEPLNQKNFVSMNNNSEKIINNNNLYNEIDIKKYIYFN